MDNSINVEQNVYVPPEKLPPPPLFVSEGANPFFAIFLGIAAAVLLGGVFFLITRFIYVYILFNVFLGAGIGGAIAYGIRENKYNKSKILFVITLFCSFLAYLVFNMCCYFDVLSQISSGESITFLQVMWARGTYETFIGGLKIGLIGNVIVWIAELIITFFVAWGHVTKTVDISNTTSVPSEVTGFIHYLMSKNYDRRQIEQELSKKGWIKQEDQEMAIQAANSMSNIVREHTAG